MGSSISEGGLMRLWSLHPMYLDSRGLVSLWREGLLAQAVLQGRTRGYTRHPQLQRFRATADPVAAVGAYLMAVCDEASRRGYAFDRSRIAVARGRRRMQVTRGQPAFEWEHLRGKLRLRAPGQLSALRGFPVPHPLFAVVNGGVALWERRVASNRR
jgi:hypothetical protein